MSQFISINGSLTNTRIIREIKFLRDPDNKRWAIKFYIEGNEAPVYKEFNNINAFKDAEARLFQSIDSIFL